jgi:hypothetical protein
MKRDLNYIAALEKAMREKFGEVTIQNPKSNWDPEKEKIYLQQSKEAYKKEAEAESSRELADLGGILIDTGLINKKQNRQCNKCEKYSFNRDDDMFLTKFSCCHICYIKYFEGRI